MIPVELQQLICSYAGDIDWHHNMCMVLGLRINRRLIYRHFWQGMHIPNIYATKFFVRWTRQYCEYRRRGPSFVSTDQFLWHEAPDYRWQEYHSWFLYRAADRPTIVFISGQKIWTVRGERHRDPGPAIIHSDLTRSWYRNNKRYHREK